MARLDLIGELRNDNGKARFQRGVTEYPNIGDERAAAARRARCARSTASPTPTAPISATCSKTRTFRVHIDIDQLVSRHFAILGATGVGKSSGVAIILQKILDTRPNLRIFLVDPHNEYGRCFGDKAQVLTPRNLRLPFWLFNFEETIDVFFGGRPGVDEEIEILSEVIPLAKSAYLQYRADSRAHAQQAARPARRRLHRRHAGALPHRGPDHAARRAHGQAGEPLLAHDLPQADRAHSDLPQSSALRLHVRERQYRRRHHGGDSRQPVPAADRTASR